MSAMTSFNGGELSPSMTCRVDTDVYHRGCLSVLNMDISQMGGIKRRRGMHKIVGAEQTEHCRLYSFTPSREASFVLAFNAGVIKAYQAGRGETWRHSNTPYIAEDLPLLRLVQINDYIVITHPNYQPRTLIYKGRNGAYDIFELSVMGFSFPPEKSKDNEDINCTIIGWDGNMPHSVAFAMYNNPRRYVAGDYVILRKDCEEKRITANKNFPSYYLWYVPNSGAAEGLGGKDIYKGVMIYTNIGGTRFYYTAIDSYYASQHFVQGVYDPAYYTQFFRPGIGWDNMQITVGDGWEFVPSGTWIGEWGIEKLNYTTNEWVQIASCRSIKGSESNPLLVGKVDDVCTLRIVLLSYNDRNDLVDMPPFLVRKAFRGRLPVCITRPWEHNVSYVNYGVFPQTMDRLSEEFHGITTKDWTPCAFNSIDGYPRCVSLHNSRLCFSSTRAQCQTVWMSAVDDINNFRQGSRDNDALAVTMSTTSQNDLLWMESQQRKLYLGSNDSEFVLSGGKDVVITPNVIVSERQSTVGAADIPSLMATESVIFVERGGRRLRQFGYNYERDGYVSSDLTVFADHILSSGVKQMAYARTPDAVVHCLLNNGTIASMTYNIAHNVNAWSRIKTNGNIKSIAVIPSSDGGGDELWLIVKRGDSVNLEIMRDGNALKDGYTIIDNKPTGVTYESHIVTTPIQFAETIGRDKRPCAVVEARFISTHNEGMEVSTDGKTWVHNGRRGIIMDGWEDFTSAVRWDKEFSVGFRTNSDKSMNILAVRASIK